MNVLKMVDKINTTCLDNSFNYDYMLTSSYGVYEIAKVVWSESDSGELVCERVETVACYETLEEVENALMDIALSLNITKTN